MGAAHADDVCVVGAGRVGFTWAVHLARNGFSVRCIDVDESVVAAIERGEPPAAEPGIDEAFREAHAAGRISATTDPAAAGDARVVGFCLYCKRHGIDEYLSILEAYAEHLSPDQTVVARSTVPLPIVDEARERLAAGVGVSPEELRYVVFPERTAAGEVEHDLRLHPAIVGTSHPDARATMEAIVSETRPRHYLLDERSAMFVKLIDNSYRDAVFALANYYVVLAEGFDLPESGSRLVEVAEDGYKNDIFLPAPVGGKCLRKDSYFLAGEWAPDDHDIFASVRAIHDDYESLLSEAVLADDPERVAILGTSFKAEVGLERAAYGVRLRDELLDAGVDVACFDPHVPRGESIEAAMDGADVTVLALNHGHFVDRTDDILAANEGTIVDCWGLLPDDPGVVRP